MRRLAVVCAVMLMAAACAQEGGDTGEQADETGPQTRTVQVDAKPDGYAGFALAYFPEAVTVRPGDTVRFTQEWTGEPHSVTLGTLVDEAIGEARELDPDEEPSDELRERFEALPTMLPEGPGDANQVAVNPCHVASGDLPQAADEPCEEQDLPAFDGTSTYYNSGFLEPGEDFEVELDEGIDPGTYVFYCNLHGPMMSGEIEVADSGEEIPSQAEVDEERDEAIAEAFGPTDDAYEAAEAGETPFGNLAGFGAEGSEGTGIIEFIPSEIEAEVGEKVTWTVFGPHTISFGTPADAAELLVQDDEGNWHLNEKAMAPAGGAGQPPPPEGDPADLGDEERPVEAPEGPPEPTEIDGGSYDGEGFRSSGFVFSFPEPGAFFSYSLTFSEPGEYAYVCIVHPAMTGTVTVGEGGSR